LEWPVCYRDDLILGNVNSNTAICTLWTKRDLLEGLPKDKFSLIGNLYSTYGINPMLRNLSANPRTRYIIVCGADLIHTGDILMNFISQGIDDDYKVRGAEAYVDRAFPREALEEMRKNVKVIDLRSEKNIDELKNKISTKLNEVSKDEEAYMKPVLIEEKGTSAKELLVEDVAFRIEGDSISGVWLKAIDNILKFGETKNTEYKIKEREILDLVSVIKGDEEELPAWLPMKREALEDYYNNFFNKEKPLGVEYTYGERLFNFKLHSTAEEEAVLRKFHAESAMVLDQVNSALRKLKKFPYSRRAIAITWRHETDPEASNPPCLIEVGWSIKYGKLYETATFRSHDIYGAWLLNAYALRKLQKEMANELGRGVGDLIIISMSAHIYENKLTNAEDLVEKQYRHREVQFEKDPRGFFVISIEGGEIVVRHRVGDGRESPYRFNGKKAQRIYRAIMNENLISKMDHAAYIGHELARAEACLKNGTVYVQDEA
jgi:thymidylate synthase